MKYNYQNITTINDFEKLLYQCINNEYRLIYNLHFLDIYKNISFDPKNNHFYELIVYILKLKHILHDELYMILTNLIEKTSANYLYLTYVLILKEYSLLNIDEFIRVFNYLKLILILNYFLYYIILSILKFQKRLDMMYWKNI